MVLRKKYIIVQTVSQYLSSINGQNALSCSYQFILPSQTYVHDTRMGLRGEGYSYTIKNDLCKTGIVHFRPRWISYEI